MNTVSAAAWMLHIQEMSESNYVTLKVRHDRLSQSHRHSHSFYALTHTPTKSETVHCAYKHTHTPTANCTLIRMPGS